jgi:carbamoyl-phosphate synthase small subunit
VWVLLKAILVLEDGTVFSGSGFGYPCEVSGEVVFNTGMVGYTETLTDPSYSGQILIQTYPLIGNYGVPPYSMVNGCGVPLNFESDKIQVSGYAVHSQTKHPSHWASEKTLDQWLIEQKIPAIEGIDTRELTKKLRMRGTMLGILKVSDSIDVDEIKQKLKAVQDPNQIDLVKEVTIEKPIFYKGQSSPVVVVIDCGCKFGILRNLLARNINVVRVPYNYSAEKIFDLNPDGVVISNGPGDPKKCVDTIEATKEFLETAMPVMGICLGNQILALAAGADTYKLKFGHRGQNHPVLDLFTKKCYITSQNHGFSIDSNSLDRSDFDIWFVNANDKTIEGIKHRSKPIFGVQFHPEASPGPYETGFLFHQFIKEVEKFHGMNR